MEPAAKLDVICQEALHDVHRIFAKSSDSFQETLHDMHQGYGEILRELDRIMEMVKKMDEVKENSGCEKVQKGCGESSDDGEESTSSDCGECDERNSTNPSIQVDSVVLPSVGSFSEGSSFNTNEDTEALPDEASTIEEDPELVVEQPGSHPPTQISVVDLSAHDSAAIMQVEIGPENPLKPPLPSSKELPDRSALPESEDTDLATGSEDQLATLKAESDVSRLLDTLEEEVATGLLPVTAVGVIPDMDAKETADRLTALASAPVSSGAGSSTAIPSAAVVMPTSVSFFMAPEVDLGGEDGTQVCGECEREDVHLDVEVSVAVKVQGRVLVQQQSQPLATAAPAPALVEEGGASQPPARAASGEWALMVGPSLFALRIRWLLVLACCGLLIGDPFMLTFLVLFGCRFMDVWMGGLSAPRLCACYVSWLTFRFLTSSPVASFDACPVGGSVLCPTWNGQLKPDRVLRDHSVQYLEVTETELGPLESHWRISDQQKACAKLAGVKSDVPHFVTISAMTKSKGSGDACYLKMITQKSEIAADPPEDFVWSHLPEEGIDAITMGVRVIAMLCAIGKSRSHSVRCSPWQH